MKKKPRILFGVTTKSHIEIALDEMYGLQDLGYTCDQFDFGGKKNFKSFFARLYVIFANTIKLLVKTYEFRPAFIYLNSRLEYVASVRDFITIIMVKLFYYKRVHFVIKSHGSDLEVLETKKIFFKNIVFPFLKRCVSGWLFLSTEEVDWIVSRNLLHSKSIFLAKNIVRVEKFQPDPSFRQKFNIAEGATILLFVGRIIKEKGVQDVVEAFARIHAQQNVVLVIVGDGEELPAVRQKVEQSDISSQVIMTGWIDESEVAQYTANSDVLVFPTYFPEGFPMALFNSMAAGLAVITTSVRAAQDYLVEPENCLWVDAKTSESIVKALNRLLNDQDLMKQMRSNNKVKSYQFTKPVVAKELAEMICSISRNHYDKKFRQVRVPDHAENK